jgi:hypothetical protein
MRHPASLASPHFAPVRLDGVFNAKRSGLPAALRPPLGDDLYGDCVVRGIPFAFGFEDALNVIVLDEAPVRIALEDARARYVIVVHVVADRPSVYLEGLADSGIDGRILGELVSEYVFQYSDGTSAAVPVSRRFGIQQTRVAWGSSAVAAVPALNDVVRRRVAEDILTTGSATSNFGEGEMRHQSALGVSFARSYPAELLWMYAVPNPAPDARVAGLELTRRDEVSAVYAVSLTLLRDHPLRPGKRRTFRVLVPEGEDLDALGELRAIGVDLGVVISARAERLYDTERWTEGDAIVHPEESETHVLVDVAGHPAARLHVGAGESSIAHELANPGEGVVEIASAERPVRMRIVDSGTGTPVAVRLHVHGPAGEYLPPRGHQREVNTTLLEDIYADLAVGRQEYAYVDGECVVDLPLDTVYIEITRGYEIVPIRRAVEIEAGTEELAFELDRVLHWRERGWVTADTHVHVLSPQTALLEGRAEDVNVVNLLATQWGEMFTNVGDFDGRTTFGAKDFGGDGEFLVRVGSENRMQVLGHISLLGYTGNLIHPLCTGGPSESAFGDPLEVAMADWARACLDQSGLVVIPHSPDPQLERAADVVLGVVDAIELMMMNPMASHFVSSQHGLNPYGIADWYRFLNLGYHVPLVAGSDKMSAGALLGGVRTYVQLGDREFSYENWIDAIREGDTFVTFGPLISCDVDGVRPGGRIDLPHGGGALTINWQVESVALPIQSVEIVVGGLVTEDVNAGGVLKAQGSAEVSVDASTWIALRVRGSYHGRAEDIAAHTSAVQVLVDGSQLFSDVDASAVLDQIEGAIAFVDTLAPRPEERHFRQLRATLEMAHNRLHQRLHHAGIYHRHSLHDPAQPHEH